VFTHSVESQVVKEKGRLIFLALSIWLQDVCTLAVFTEVEKGPCKAECVSCRIRSLEVVIVKWSLREWLSLSPLSHQLISCVSEQYPIDTPVIYVSPHLCVLTCLRYQPAPT
jgi:hypothetical protein